MVSLAELYAKLMFLRVGEEGWREGGRKQKSRKLYMSTQAASLLTSAEEL